MRTELDKLIAAAELTVDVSTRDEFGPSGGVKGGSPAGINPGLSGAGAVALAVAAVASGLDADETLSIMPALQAREMGRLFLDIQTLTNTSLPPGCNEIRELLRRLEIMAGKLSGDGKGFLQQEAMDVMQLRMLSDSRKTLLALSRANGCNLTGGS